MFKIGEVSKLLGVDRSFLHYYDEIGIIVPRKNEKNYRLYNENDLIAIASSKYYRAMNMPLKPLSHIILQSDGEKKIEVMKQQKQLLLEEAERLNDLAIVADYALNTYEIAYQMDILALQPIEAFEFIPIIHDGRYDERLINSETMKELLDFFPFVSYAYYFPTESLINQDKFSYMLGLSAIQKFRIKYNKCLPETAITSKEHSCFIMPLTQNIENQAFTYESFERARDYAASNSLTMTGEAIAYCVFTNYEKEYADIKFVVQIITK